MDPLNNELIFVLDIDPNSEDLKKLIFSGQAYTQTDTNVWAAPAIKLNSQKMMFWVIIKNNNGHYIIGMIPARITMKSKAEAVITGFEEPMSTSAGIQLVNAEVGVDAVPTLMGYLTKLQQENLGHWEKFLPAK